VANEKHLLLTFGGDYTDAANAGEIWQNSLRLTLVFGGADPVGTLPSNWEPVAADINRTETKWTITGNWTIDGPLTAGFSPDDWLNDQVAGALDTWLGQSGIANKVRLLWAKVFPIGSNGKALPAPPYSQGSPILLSWTSAYPTGDDGGNILPLQNALVISHRSAQTGRKGRGRMFRAGMSVNANDADGKVPSTIQGYLLSAQVALLEALSVADSGVDTPQVRPAIIGSPWTHYGTINQVRVGNRMDTQRRRRDQVDETYTAASPSYG
jgi:hypothetical protein